MGVHLELKKEVESEGCNVEERSLRQGSRGEGITSEEKGGGEGRKGKEEKKPEGRRREEG